GIGRYTPASRGNHMPIETESLETLRYQASASAAAAAALTRAYERTTWIRFALTFFPVPFAVLLFRLQLDYWHYYLAGAAYIVFSMALYYIDEAAERKCDDAVHAAQRAQKMLEEAS